MIAVTIFTPTYNRGYTLPQLYGSLIKQTIQDFEWIIVDDGSTDDTENVVRQFINEKVLKIEYYKVNNGGKHSAINVGVEKAKAPLFLIVDSDDWLASNAIERILYHYSYIKHDETFAGVVGLRAFGNGQRIGGEINFGILDCSYLELRYVRQIKGDMVEVFKTDILRQYAFPVFQGEKFCPEALVWNRIGCTYKMRHFYEKIGFCEYLADGLTAKITRLRMKSPEASLLYYSELYRMPVPFWQKIKAAINYWRFSYNSKRNYLSKLSQIGWETLGLSPLGYILYIKDRIHESSSGY